MLKPNSKLTYNFHDKEEISQRILGYVCLPPRKKKEIRTELKNKDEAESNELLAWFEWWDEYHQ